MAALLSVSTGTVKAWHHAGLITGHPYNDKGQCLYPPPGPNPRAAHKDASSASEPLSSPPPPAAHEPAGLSDPTATVSTSNNTRTCWARIPAHWERPTVCVSDRGGHGVGIRPSK
jgi:hypothetical protein